MEVPKSDDLSTKRKRTPEERAQIWKDYLEQTTPGGTIMDDPRLRLGTLAECIGVERAERFHEEIDQSPSNISRRAAWASLARIRS